MRTAQSTMTAGRVLAALHGLAGLTFGQTQLAYLSPVRRQVLAAIERQDGPGLADAAAEGVERSLHAAGVLVEVSEASLRELVTRDGWRLVDAATGGAKHAADALRRQLPHSGPQPGAERAPAATGTDPATPVVRPAMAAAARGDGRPARTYTRQVPLAGVTRQPPRRHNAGDVRTIGAARASHPGSGVQREFEQKKVFGSRAALSFEPAESRRREPTVLIEAAPIVAVGQRSYDWARKISVQLTQLELQLLTAQVLMGAVDDLRFQNHGPEQDKWFHFQRQSGQYAGTIKATVGKGRDAYIVQITPSDRGQVAALLRRQCCALLKCDSVGLEQILRIVAEAYVQAQAARQNGAPAVARRSA